MADKEKEEKVEGYFVGEVTTATDRVIAIDGKPIDSLELLAKVANAVLKAGLMKVEDK